MEDDSGEVRGGDRIEKVGCSWSGVFGVSETYPNFFELGAWTQSDWTKSLYV